MGCQTGLLNTDCSSIALDLFCICVIIQLSWLQRRMRDILESWLKVQAAWLYLEPIFGSEDIRRQIPVEGKMFEEVDANWLVLCHVMSYIRVN